MKIQDFLNTDLCDYASYSTVRQISSYIDGLKNSSRKVVFTLLEQKIVNKLKVLQLSNKCAEYSDYLHGSLDGVVVSLGANYVGANNINLVEPSGNFGTRLAPEASAPRYIFGSASENLFKLFDYDDSAVLTYQTFEGARIEPKFYVPNLPMILVNGSTGLATGFRQDILPRDPENLKKYCQKYVEGTLTKKDEKLLQPFVKGFTGTFIQDKTNPLKYTVCGKIMRTDKTKLLVTEMPLGFDYKSAIKHFDKLEESKVIDSYEDLCDTEADTFTFEVKMRKADLDRMSEDELLEKLKLKSTYTEILTTLDENLKIKIFDSIPDLIKAYMEVKLHYNQLRKEHILNRLGAEIALNNSKYEFIKRIVEGTLIVQKRKKDDIVKDLEKIKEIIKKEDSYDYLLSMPIYSLTKERMDKLSNTIKELKAEQNAVKGKTPEMIFIEDLGKIQYTIEENMITENLKFDKDIVDSHPLVKKYFYERLKVEETLKNKRDSNMNKIRELKNENMHKRIEEHVNTDLIIMTVNMCFENPNEDILKTVLESVPESKKELYTNTSDYIMRVISTIKSNKAELEELKKETRNSLNKIKGELRSNGYKIAYLDHAYSTMKEKVRFYLENDINLDNNGMSGYEFLDDVIDAFTVFEVLKKRDIIKKKQEALKQAKAERLKSKNIAEKRALEDLSNSGIRTLIESALRAKSSAKKALENKKEKTKNILRSLGMPEVALS